MMDGRILHLQRFSTEDGPGIRTTVFFKGCGLRCAWCHNPESLSANVQIQWFANRCLSCLTCLSTCPNGCLEMTDDGLAINREICEGCASCAVVCPANALEALGRKISVGELLKELVKDRAYYETSGGGVTISGGEPGLQPEFAESLLQHLQTLGIATALDTCGLCSSHALERLLQHTDLLLYDLKIFDPEIHHQLTGQNNQLIIENLLMIHNYVQNTAKHLELWIRTPLIPNATATEENILAIGRFITEKLDGSVQRWELCAFNNLCEDKYKRLGMDWEYSGQPLMRADELRHWESVARRSGVKPELVLATGATQIG